MAIVTTNLNKVATARTKGDKKLTYQLWLTKLRDIGWTDEDIAFAGFDSDADLSANITDTQYQYALQLYTNGVNSWDFSNNTQLAIMPHFATARTDVKFTGCSNLKYIPVLTVTPATMAAMFKGCSNLKAANLTNWTTTAVTSFAEAFRGCQSLTQKSVDTINKLNTTAATNFSQMFQSFKATSLTLTNWTTSSVTNWSSMFNLATITTLTLKVNFSAATTIAGMFNSYTGTTITTDGCTFAPSTSCVTSDLFNTATNTAIARVYANGASVQSTTPTVAAPVPVKCNNGDVYVDYIGAAYPIATLTAEEEEYAYGVEIDYSVSGYPTVTRIGSSTLHASLPIQSGMVGGTLLDNGVFRPFTHTTDWSTETRDGSAGQVMVKLPRHYVKIERTGDKERIKISQRAIKGYRYVREQYIGAYQFVMDNVETKGCSLVSMAARYRGGANNSAWDDTYRTSLGRCRTGLQMSAYRTAARARGNGWEGYNHYTRHTLSYFFVIEYATLNSQAAINSTLTTEGYHQGGLGDGVTGWSGSAWSSYNSYNPFVPNGTSDTLGNGTGEVSYEVKDADDATVYTAKVNRYRGVEIPFGHVWQFIDGVVEEIGSASATNLSKVFVAPDPTNWGDTDVNNPAKYNYIGNEARSSNYGHTLSFTTGAIQPVTVGGSSTGYDYHYTDVPTSGVALRCAIGGGNANNGGNAGLFNFNSNNGLTNANANIGSHVYRCGLSNSLKGDTTQIGTVTVPTR